MNEIMKVFGQVSLNQRFDSIKISIASPERIRSWSFGEIKKRDHQLPDFQAGTDGLFCAYFRSDQGLRMSCGKYKR